MHPLGPKALLEEETATGGPFYRGPGRGPVPCK